jgi:hypothetical protein
LRRIIAGGGGASGDPAIAQQMLSQHPIVLELVVRVASSSDAELAAVALQLLEMLARACPPPRPCGLNAAQAVSLQHLRFR